MRKLQKVLRLFRYKNKKIFGTIGKGNFFADGTYLDDNAIIGNYNYFGTRCMILFTTIGNYCSIAPSVIIAPANHSIDFITTSNAVVKRCKSFPYDLFQKRTLIGNDVWIGANAVIVQGINIGNGVVIGANAFVNKDIPPYAVAVGSPAKIVRYRFEENIQKAISQSNWWDKDILEAVSTVDNLNVKFIKKNDGVEAKNDAF